MAGNVIENIPLSVILCYCCYYYWCVHDGFVRVAWDGSKLVLELERA